MKIPTKNALSGKMAASFLLAGLAVGALTVTAGAEGAGSQRPKDLPPQEIRVIGAGGDVVSATRPASEVEAYCLNIADKAQDARYALEKQQLSQLESEISKRIDELESKRQSYQTWLDERRAFLDNASTVVVDIYSSMKADAAAAQLTKLDRPAAASILVKLKSRQASAILTEMKADTAAEITTLIVEKTSAGTSADAQAAVADKPEGSRS